MVKVVDPVPIEGGLIVESAPSPVCSKCNDTHMVQDSRYEHEIMCTGCPVPCQECRVGGKGAFCGETPCSCECHRKDDDLGGDGPV